MIVHEKQYFISSTDLIKLQNKLLCKKKIFQLVQDNWMGRKKNNEKKQQ